MFKILLLAIAFWLLYSLLKRYRNNMNQQPPAQSKSQSGANDNSLMVQCAYCQVHLPSNESIKQGQLHFCSQDHARQHQP